MDSTPTSQKDIASTFLRLASSGKVREARAAFIDPSFRHHNPFFQADADALFSAMEENAIKNSEKMFQILHVLEDGDLVAIHSHVKQTAYDPGFATLHLFRFEGNRIVELWDISQAVPTDSENENGMF